VLSFIAKLKKKKKKITKNQQPDISRHSGKPQHGCYFYSFRKSSGISSV